ncbi:MAG: M4 family metallopeptidase [Deltaproteobacteria bacterium]|nr:M4 family metallopeptidase [Deltaproteobacteria bacterium]
MFSMPKGFHLMNWRVSLLAMFSIVVLSSSALTAASTIQDNVLSWDQAGVPTFLEGQLGALDMDLDRGEAAVSYLREMAREDLQATGAEELLVRRVDRDELGYVHVRMDQKINGLRVLGSRVIVHADDLTGEVYAVSGRFVSATELPATATMPAIEALEIAAESAGISGKATDEPELVYVLGENSHPHLAWRNRVEYESKDGLEVDDLFADAATGFLVARHPRIHRAKNWRTHSSNNTGSLPGTLRCTNNQSCGDGILQNIHNGSSLVYDYYNARFGRKSYNGSDITINSVGHHLSNYNNAFWNGSYLVYGDGNGVQFGPLGNAFDIVAHEFTHAVTENESGLIYRNESGALNEAWSDIFAAGAEFWKDGYSADIWKLGEDVYTPGTAGDALRYMNNPTLDGVSQDYYPERYTGSADNGGVHWNSGIANLAFYLAVEGGQHPRGKTNVVVPSIGADAEAIFYRAQTTYLTPSSNFASARSATGQAAMDLFGATYRDNIYTAWCAVGVGSCPTAGTNNSQYITQSVPTSMTPNQTTTVSVTIKNTGTTTWTRAGNYRLGSQNPQDNLRWGIGRVDLPSNASIAPGQQWTFTFTIRAPAAPATYNFQWRMVKEGVAWFGAFSQNRQIAVTSGGGTNNAQYISQSVPTTLLPGETRTVSVTMKNTGTSTWTRAAGFKLGSQSLQGNTTWGLTRVWLPSNVSVAPGQQRTFTFNITAPSAVGTYNFRWRMVKEGVAWFGAFSPNRQIQVQAATNNAEFVSYVGVPTTMTRGQTAVVRVTMRNNGTRTWTRSAGHKLGSENPRDNRIWNLNRVWLPSNVSVAPGQQRTFVFTIRAPSSPGTYNFQWRMVQDGVQWFGAFSPNRQIVVN